MSQHLHAELPPEREPDRPSRNHEPDPIRVPEPSRVDDMIGHPGPKTPGRPDKPLDPREPVADDPYEASAIVASLRAAQHELDRGIATAGNTIGPSAAVHSITHAFAALTHLDHALAVAE